MRHLAIAGAQPFQSGHGAERRSSPSNCVGARREGGGLHPPYAAQSIKDKRRNRLQQLIHVIRQIARGRSSKCRTIRTLAIASSSAPAWENWSGNLLHKPPTDGSNYYFMPGQPYRMRTILAKLQGRGRDAPRFRPGHSQPPLVIGDNRNTAPSATGPVPGEIRATGISGRDRTRASCSARVQTRSP